ncbi:MAG: hypothetical protein MI725_16050 [Pirellulales bacterium]|nr:hypothetical protein [Pirellulales bacterium]
MDRTEAFPRIAFVINLDCGGIGAANDSRVRHLVHLFQGHRLPVTWAVEDAQRAKAFPIRLAGPADHELALVLSADKNVPASRFLRETGHQVAALRSLSGVETTLVVGDAAELRPRTAILAQQGVGAILSSCPAPASQAAPRPLPCGLWQLQPSLSLPLPRRLWRLLPAGRCTAKQLVALGMSNGPILILINAAKLCEASPRGLQAFEKLLREVSWAARYRQLTLARMSDVVAELASQRRIKPQRSILHAAA